MSILALRRVVPKLEGSNDVFLIEETIPVEVSLTPRGREIAHVPAASHQLDEVQLVEDPITIRVAGQGNHRGGAVVRAGRLDRTTDRTHTPGE